MRKLIVLAGVLALTACSSKEKEETVMQEAPAVTEAPMEAPAAMPEPAPEPEPSGGALDIPASGDFPAISGTERMMANCSNGSDSRTISVLDIADKGGCGVVYTKGGNPATVAMARNDMSYCDKVFDNIKGNLGSAGFDCGEGSGASSAAAMENSTPVAEANEAVSDTKEMAKGMEVESKKSIEDAKDQMKTGAEAATGN